MKTLQEQAKEEMLIDGLGLVTTETATAMLSAIDTLEAEVARLKRVAAAARELPRVTPGISHASLASAEIDFKIAAWKIWQLDNALTAYDRGAGPVSRPQAKEDVVELIADEIAAWRNDTLRAFGIGSMPPETTDPDRSLARRLAGLLSTKRERG